MSFLCESYLSWSSLWLVTYCVVQSSFTTQKFHCHSIQRLVLIAQITSFRKTTTTTKNLLSKGSLIWQKELCQIGSLAWMSYIQYAIKNKRQLLVCNLEDWPVWDTTLGTLRQRKWNLVWPGVCAGSNIRKNVFLSVTCFSKCPVT